MIFSKEDSTHCKNLILALSSDRVVLNNYQANEALAFGQGWQWLVDLHKIIDENLEKEESKKPARKPRSK